MKTSSILCALSVALVFAPSANAYLGSFEPSDGYTLSNIPGTPTSTYTDVTYYNAGQFGANAGGGSPIQISPDSGLWDLKSTAGAFYSNTTDRTTDTGAAPPYPGASALTVPIYIVGNHFGGRTGFSALALRNELNFGPMEYDYTFDTYDFGGISPASITTGNVLTSFYFCPNPTSQIRKEKFVMSFDDSLGNTGLQVGYNHDNEVIWRAGDSGLWNASAIIANGAAYDGFSVDIDLSNDTFQIDYYIVASNTTVTLAPAGTALGNSMLDLTHLGWWLDEGVVGGIGGKNFFDDFAVHTGRVPEPSSMILLGIAVIGGVFAVKRRKM